MTLSGLSKVFRAREWWHTKVPMMLGIFCFSYLEAPGTAQDFAKHLCLLLLWTMVTASFGFFLNEVFDHDQDIAAGKQNFTGKISRRNKLIGSLLLAALSASVWLWHPLLKFQLAAAILQLLLFCTYSIPPLRLKESGWPGVFIDSLYAFVVPSVIAYGAAKSFFSELSVDHTLFLLGIWTSLAGIRNILNHHIKDRRSDAISGVKNLANIYGVDLILKICHTVLLFELSAFAAYLYCNPGKPAIKAVFLLVYFLFNSFSASRYGLRFNLKRKIATLRFNFNSLYEGWLLIAATLFLISADKRFFALLLFELFLFRNEAHYLLLLFLSSFYFKILKPMPAWIRFNVVEVIWYHGIGRLWYHGIGRFWYHGIVWLGWQIWRCGSLSVNYSIYYYRRWVLKQDDRTARRQKPVAAGEPVKVIITKEPPAVKAEKKIARDISGINSPGKITEDNLVVNGLWIGSQLSKIELLTITSFIAHGHRFRLWVYDRIETPLPFGLELMDANEIIDRSKVFRYKYFNKYGHGKGSVSGFSDIFRYKLLYDKGGWWVDMDVTCLKPLNFETDYFFRNHHDLLLVGNIMKAPKKSDLMKMCYEQASLEINELNTDWLRPIQILNEKVLQLGLDNFVFNNFSNEDRWDQVAPMIKRDKKMPEDYFLMHWMNEEWRSRGMDKNDIRFGSTLGKILTRYGLLSPPKKRFDELKTDFRHLFYLPVYEYFS